MRESETPDLGISRTGCGSGKMGGPPEIPCHRTLEGYLDSKDDIFILIDPGRRARRMSPPAKPISIARCLLFHPATHCRDLHGPPSTSPPALGVRARKPPLHVSINPVAIALTMFQGMDNCARARRRGPRHDIIAEVTIKVSTAWTASGQANSWQGSELGRQARAFSCE